jgi:hypothetical protein
MISVSENFLVEPECFFFYKIRSVPSTFRYIDDVPSLNNSRFSDFVDRIYPIELEIKDTITNMLSMLMISVSENFLVEPECFFFYKIRSVPS